jgi:hypothetical protein
MEISEVNKNLGGDNAPQKKDHHNKIVVYLFVAVVIVGLVIYYFSVAPSTEENGVDNATVDNVVRNDSGGRLGGSISEDVEITYVNTNYSYAFNHPFSHTPYISYDNVEKKFTRATNAARRVLIAENEFDVPTGKSALLAVEAFNVEKTARKWFDENKLDYANFNDIVTEQDTIFAGKPAVEMLTRGLSSDTSAFKLIVVEGDGFVIVITLNKPSDFLERALASFRFF